MALLFRVCGFALLLALVVSLSCVEGSIGSSEEGNGDTDTDTDGDGDSDTDTDSDTDSDADTDTDSDTDSDSDSDSDEDTATDTGPPTSCNGTIVGPGCWYYASTAASCESTCSTHGGYSEVTNTYAGKAGTTPNCNSVLNSLGAPGTTTGGMSASGNLGCFYYELLGDRYRESSFDTTAAGSQSGTRRACACNE